MTSYLKNFSHPRESLDLTEAPNGRNEDSSSSSTSSGEDPLDALMMDNDELNDSLGDRRRQSSLFPVRQASAGVLANTGDGDDDERGEGDGVERVRRTSAGSSPKMNKQAALSALAKNLLAKTRPGGRRSFGSSVATAASQPSGDAPAPGRRRWAVKSRRPARQLTEEQQEKQRLAQIEAEKEEQDAEEEEEDVQSDEAAGTEIRGDDSPSSSSSTSDDDEYGLSNELDPVPEEQEDDEDMDRAHELEEEMDKDSSHSDEEGSDTATQVDDSDGDVDDDARTHGQDSTQVRSGSSPARC